MLLELQQSVVVIKAKVMSLAENKTKSPFNRSYFFSHSDIENQNLCAMHVQEILSEEVEFLRRGYVFEMQSRKIKAEPFTLPGTAVVSDLEPYKKKAFLESYCQRRISRMSNIIKFGNGLSFALDLSSHKTSLVVKEKLVNLLRKKFGLIFDSGYQLCNPNKLAFFESYCPLLYECDINPFSVVDFLSILTPNKWLTTKAVSFALNFVSRSFDNVFTISCDTNIPLVSTTSQPDKKEQLSNTFSQVPKHCSVLLLPLYVKVGRYMSDIGRNHFILAVINFKESCFHLMDSFDLSNKNEAIIILNRIKALCYNDERYLNLSYKGYPVHPQNDVYNCGIYAIIHANEYLEKQVTSEPLQPDFQIQEVLQRLRPELCLQILEDMDMVHDRHLFCYICRDKPESEKQRRCHLCAAVVCQNHDFHFCMICNTGTDEVVNETNLEGVEITQNQFLPNDISWNKQEHEDKAQIQDAKPCDKLDLGVIAVYQKELGSLLNTPNVVKPARHPRSFQLTASYGTIIPRNRKNIPDTLSAASKFKGPATKHDTYRPIFERGDGQVKLSFTTSPTYYYTRSKNKSLSHVSCSPMTSRKETLAEVPSKRTRVGRLVRPPIKLDL